jgi:hypothetical protein
MKSNRDVAKPPQQTFFNGGLRLAFFEENQGIGVQSDACIHLKEPLFLLAGSKLRSTTKSLWCISFPKLFFNAD